jgi:hypothetical protein
LKIPTLLQVQVKYQNTLVSHKHGMLNKPRRLHTHLNREYKSTLGHSRNKFKRFTLPLQRKLLPSEGVPE